MIEALGSIIAKTDSENCFLLLDNYSLRKNATFIFKSMPRISAGFKSSWKSWTIFVETFPH